MGDGINYTVRYETAGEVREIDTVEFYNVEDGMVKVHWYPHAETWTSDDDLVNREVHTTHIPKERVIEIEEK